MKRTQIKDYAKDSSIVSTVITLIMESMNLIKDCPDDNILAQYGKIDTDEARFNTAYRMSMTNLFIQLVDPDILIDPEFETSNELLKKIHKFDRYTRNELAYLYAAEINTNKKSIMVEIKNHIDGLEYVKFDGEIYHTDIIRDFGFISKYAFDVYNIALIKIWDAYQKQAKLVADRDTEEMMRVFKESEGIDPDRFRQEYFLDNDKGYLLKKYLTIINYVLHTRKFNSKLFNKTINERFYELEKTDYDIQKKYLIRSLPKDASYCQNKKYIIDLVNLAEMQHNRFIKEEKEKEKYLDGIYGSKDEGEIQTDKIDYILDNLNLG